MDATFGIIPNHFTDEVDSGAGGPLRREDFGPVLFAHDWEGPFRIHVILVH